MMGRLKAMKVASFASQWQDEPHAQSVFLLMSQYQQGAIGGKAEAAILALFSARSRFCFQRLLKLLKLDWECSKYLNREDWGIWLSYFPEGLFSEQKMN